MLSKYVNTSGKAHVTRGILSNCEIYVILWYLIQISRNLAVISSYPKSMKEIKGIKNIVFDLGGVLIDLDREACIEKFREIGFNQADKLLTNYRQKGIFKGLEMGTVSPRELYNYINSEVGHPIDTEKINEALRAFLVGLPVYKMDMLLRLRQYYKVFMLSNTNPIMIEPVRNKFFRQQGLTINDYFDRLFLSFEMGMLKPDAGIFKAVLYEAGIKANETLFIDDSATNIDAALKLGFKTYMPAPKEDFRHIFQ